MLNIFLHLQSQNRQLKVHLLAWPFFGIPHEGDGGGLDPPHLRRPWISMTSWKSWSWRPNLKELASNWDRIWLLKPKAETKGLWIFGTLFRRRGIFDIFDVFSNKYIFVLKLFKKSPTIPIDIEALEPFNLLWQGVQTAAKPSFEPAYVNPITQMLWCSIS